MQQRAIITGASSGIGFAIAQELGRCGHELVCIGRDPKRLKKAVKQLRDLGFLADSHVGDLRLGKARKILIDDILGLGPVDVLVNNAGIGLNGKFADGSFRDHRDLWRLNTEAAMHLCHLLAPHMIARGGGHMLNVASIAGFMPGPGMAGYFASKSALLSFSVSLREELMEHHVSVSALCPGVTDTDFFARAGCQERFAEAPGFAVSQPDFVARKALQGLMKNRAIITPGLVNKCATLATRLFPTVTLAGIMGRRA
ncbi:MAG TPA: short-chain dehydrogenase [Alphaproteobacteria bacterium]|nr:short-chain dehydrogenase [Alphaproteobacteria bacterium]